MRSVFLTICLLAQCPLYAQFVPLVAKVHETQTVTENGQTVVNEVRDGVFYRRSDGSTLTQWLNPPTARPVSGILFDQSSQSFYSVDYNHGEARLRRQMNSKRLPPSFNIPPSNILGYDSVENIRCVVVPVRMGRGGPKIGEACLSTDLGITLKEEETALNGGQATHITTSYRDIQVGFEPSASLFSLKNFKLVSSSDSRQQACTITK